jgi:hypothetical protein
MNATKADPDPNILYPVSVDSFSCQHCFTFQLLELSRAINQNNDSGVTINCFPTDAIQFKWAKASQSEGGSFKVSLYTSVKISLMM